MNEREIFVAAFQTADPASRRRLLDEACAADPEMRRRVEILLHKAEQAGSFLEQSPVSPLIPKPGTATCGTGPVTESDGYDPVPAAAGQLITGRYRLLEEIGAGGMGSVWMAEQTEPVQRRVAVKLIKPGMDSRHVIARFEAERQALALMDHPNIAKVLDGGATADGRPFFVMELVKGTPITKYCDEKKLPVRERLELFADVCRAVQHAHQKGIIHRDIKPSNVLVAPYDGRPVVKVIDFGVAKATARKLTESTLFTGFGSVIGTPEYMSPEQAEVNNADIDTRSDVYSLGVLLYELLTGTTPLTRQRVKEAALLEVLRVIREEEPARPSTRLSTASELPTIAAVRGVEPAKLSRLVRGELDWIAMKALDKDRSRRYETANGFAMDVQRYLANEPVQACPPSAGYRLRKFVRRNARTVAFGATIAAMLAVGVAVSAWLAVTARQAERTAIKERDDKEKARQAEVEERKRARRAVDDMYTQVAQKWLGRQPRLQKVQREFLEKVLKYYQEFSQEESSDPEVRLETAQAYRRVGAILQKLGESAQAAESLKVAIELASRLDADFPATRKFREELAQGHHDLGYLQMYNNQRDEAEKSFGRALSINERLIADFGTDATLEQGLASGLHNQGIIVSGLMGLPRRPDEAKPLFIRSVKHYKEAISLAPNEAEYPSGLGGALSDWAMLLLQRGDPTAAAPLLEEAIIRQREAIKLDPLQPRYRQFLTNHLAGWADIAESRGNRKLAVETAREALKVQTALAVDFPDVPHYRHAQAERARDLGMFLMDANPKEAEAVFRQAVELLEPLSDSFADVPARQSLLGDSYNSIAILQEEAKRYPEAEASYRAARKWIPKNTDNLSSYGRCLLIKQGKPDEAEPVLRECLALLETKSPNHWKTFDMKSMLGASLMAQEKYGAAEPLLLAGYEGMKKRLATMANEDRIHWLQAIDLLAQLYEGWDKPEQAGRWRKELAAQKAAPKKD